MPGNIINIVSNDAKTIELLGLPLLAVLFSPLDIAISLAIVWMVGSWQGLIGTSFLVIVFAYGAVAAKRAGQLRRNAAELIDKRLQLIEEIIKGIRAMKMYAWEWNFRALVARIRRLVPVIHYGDLCTYTYTSQRVNKLVYKIAEQLHVF